MVHVHSGSISNFNKIATALQMNVYVLICYQKTTSRAPIDIQTQLKKRNITVEAPRSDVDVSLSTSEKDHAPLLALHAAVREGRIDEIACLLLKPTNLEERDGKGRTALHAACEMSPSTVRAEMVRMLLHAGAYIEARDNHGQTPLHVAAPCTSASVSK